MSLQPQIRSATVKSNLNLKTTIQTKHNIGDATMVSDNVEARVLGIPGSDGKDGRDGNFVWKGEYNSEPFYYQKYDVVTFNGVTFIYINETAGLFEIPSGNTLIWDIFTGEPEMRTEVNELPNGDLIVGKTLADALDSDLKWSIKKVLFIDEDISIIWANTDSGYNYSWNLRLTYFP